MHPRVGDDSVMMRWMQLEISRINEGIVSDRKTLAGLLLESRPASITKGGKEYLFDRATILELGQKVPCVLQKKLALPILFFFDSAVRDSAFLADETALYALQALGELSTLRAIRDGRIWIGRAIVYAIVRRYPTAAQIVMQ